MDYQEPLERDKYEYSAPPPKRPFWLRYTLRILRIDLVLLIVVSMVAIPAGVRNIYQYGNVLILGGALLVGLGTFALIGGWSQTRRFEYQHAESAGANTMLERARREAAITDSNLGYFIQMLLASIPPLVIGTLLQIAFTPPPATPI